MAAVAGVLGAVVVAALTFYFDRRREIDVRWQQERIEAAVAFTGAIEAYRSAQKRRAHHNTNRAVDGVIDREHESEALADAVGAARTAAWASAHRIRLVAEDSQAPDLCRRALGEVAAIGGPDRAKAVPHATLDAQGDAVRRTMEEFSSLMAQQLNKRAARRR